MPTTDATPIDPHHNTAEIISASPIDTIRSLVSPHLTYVRSTEGLPDSGVKEADPSVYLSCLNDYFQMSSLTSVVGLSFQKVPHKQGRTTSEELFS